MTTNCFSAKLSSIASLHRITVDPSKLPEESIVAHYSLPSWSSRSPEKVSAHSIKSNKIELPIECVLVSRLNPIDPICHPLNPIDPKTWRVSLDSSKSNITHHLCSTEWAVLVPNEGIDIDYLYAAVTDISFQEQLDCYVTGTSASHQRVLHEDLLNCIIRRFPLEDEVSIGSAVRSIHSLERNRKAIQSVLFDISVALFNYQFDNFEVGEQSRKLVTSKKLGSLPENWDVISIREGVELVETGSRPPGGVASIDQGVPSIGAESICRIGTFDYTKRKNVPEEFFDKMRKGIIQDGDILLYKDGGSPGMYIPKITRIGKGFPFEKAAVNGHVYRIRATPPFDDCFLFHWLNSHSGMFYLAEYGGGSAIPGISKSSLLQIPLIRPPDKAISEFSSMIDGTHQLILLFARQNRVSSVLLKKLIEIKFIM